MIACKPAIERGQNSALTADVNYSFLDFLSAGGCAALCAFTMGAGGGGLTLTC
jgi:hypothetical protein